MTSLRAWSKPEVGYTYWVLRYVPDALRGEFINIGVVVGRDDEWAVRRIMDLGRASRLGGDPSECRHWLERIERRFSPTHDYGDVLALALLGDRPNHPRADGVSWMERLRRQQENTLQVSQPRPVGGDSALGAAELLFQRLVVAPAARSMPRGRLLAVHTLREAFREQMSRSAYQPDVRLGAGAQRTRIDFAVGGTKVVQLSQVFSFEARTTEYLRTSVQSSSYTFSRVRKQGGHILNPRRRRQGLMDVHPDVALRVLFIPPTGPSQREIFEVARDAWHDLGVVAFEHGAEDELVSEAKSLLA